MDALVRVFAGPRAVAAIDRVAYEWRARRLASRYRAQAAVEHGAETMPEGFAALARLLLRAEGVASPFIEGVTAPVVDIVLAEADQGGAPSAAAWVAANLAAVTEAIEEAHARPLTVESLCAWHRTLMTGSPTPARHVGVLRTEQGWIGGTSPVDAHLVTPPPDEVPALVDDLIAYVNRDDIDPVSQATITHAQFEIIHPLADGNGRVSDHTPRGDGDCVTPVDRVLHPDGFVGRVLKVRRRPGQAARCYEGHVIMATEVGGRVALGVGGACLRSACLTKNCRCEQGLRREDGQSLCVRCE